MSDAHEPPSIPDVVDEAAATPPWLPRVGLVLLGLVLAYVVITQVVEQQATAPGTAAEAAE